MWRHSENSSYLIDLKFSGFEELCFVGRDRDRRVFHAFLQHRHLVRVGTAAEGRIPALSHLARVFQHTRMLQHTAGGGTIGVELTAIFLCGDGKTDGVLRHCNRTVSNQTIKPQTRNVKDILWLENDRAAFHGMGIIGTKLVLIVELTVLISVNCHSVRHQRV